MLTYKCFTQQRVNEFDYSIFPIQKDDVELIRVWRNNQMNVLRQKKRIGKKDQEKYFIKNIWCNLDSDYPPQILMGLYFKDNLIGYGGLVHISWEDKRAEVSFLLNPERMENFELYKKDFTHYLSLIKNLSLKQLKLNKLFSETYAFRERHISILEEAGFKKEGIMKEHIILNGRPIDSIIHGIIL